MFSKIAISYDMIYIYIYIINDTGSGRNIQINVLEYTTHQTHVNTFPTKTTPYFQRLDMCFDHRFLLTYMDIITPPGVHTPPLKQNSSFLTPWGLSTLERGYTCCHKALAWKLEHTRLNMVRHKCIVV